MLKTTLLACFIILFSGTGVALTAEKKPPKNVEKLSKPDSSMLRCWQQGKLLFTETRWHSFTIANKENVLNFTRDEKSNQSLSLINMGDTICLYQKQDS